MKQKNVRIHWRGKEVMTATRDAQKRGVNRTMSECVIHAKQNHQWQNRTGVLERSLRIVDYAHEHLRGVQGVWGSTDVVYARRLELGFVGKDRLGRRYNQRPYPYLRPAADAIYPLLADYIRRAMQPRGPIRRTAEQHAAIQRAMQPRTSRLRT